MAYARNAFAKREILPCLPSQRHKVTIPRASTVALLVVPWNKIDILTALQPVHSIYPFKSARLKVTCIDQKRLCVLAEMFMAWNAVKKTAHYLEHQRRMVTALGAFWTAQYLSQDHSQSQIFHLNLHLAQSHCYARDALLRDARNSPLLTNMVTVKTVIKGFTKMRMMWGIQSRIKISTVLKGINCEDWMPWLGILGSC